MPSPQPSPTGEGAGCGRFKCCRPSEKECRNINGRNFSDSLYRKADGTNAASVFFRRPLNPSVGCVPRGTHTVGWDCRENGERVRAYRTHPTCGLRPAAQPIFLAEPLTPTVAPSSLPWERVRERATSRKACIWVVKVLGKIAAILGDALSPALPHGGGSRLQQIQMLQVV